ncbi:MAG TPA: TonB family protein [Vicinamibacterales bacterium]|nr:TonB family protein [Vicinamibacterales bacterium]
MKSHVLATVTLVVTLVSTAAFGQAPAPLREIRLPGLRVSMPSVSKQVLPRHPDQSGAGMAGVVELEVVVGVDGSVADARIAKSAGPTPALDYVALEAVREWEFTAAVSENHNVPALVVVRMQFAASREAGQPGAVSATVVEVPERTTVIDQSAPVPEARNMRDGGLQAPQLRRQVGPSYTSDAMRAKIQGDVELDIVIMADGTVGSARVTKSLDSQFGLDRQALQAASYWLFEPAKLNGRPVPAHVTLVLTFRLH